MRPWPRDAAPIPVRPGTVFNGLFDFYTFAPLPAYYALFSWADLRDLGKQVEARVGI